MGLSWSCPRRLLVYLCLYVCFTWCVLLFVTFGRLSMPPQTSRSHYDMDLVKPPMLYDHLFSDVGDVNATRERHEQLEMNHVLAWLGQRAGKAALRLEDLPRGKIKLNASSSAIDVNKYYLHADIFLFRSWSLNSIRYCNGRMWGYDHMFLWFHDIVFHPRLAYSPAAHSAHKAVIEEQELYSFQHGAFVVDCINGPLSYSFKGKSTTLNKWFGSLLYNDSLGSVEKRIDGLTIALERHEYANVYWTMVDLYNAFLITKFMNSTRVTVLLVDAHPLGILDSLWTLLFPGSTQLHTIQDPSQFDRLVWAFHRSNSPLMQRQSHPPLLDDFRDYVLSQTGLPLRHHVDCAHRSLRALFVWRRDYASHIRNVKGTVERKISNEDALLKASVLAFPRWSIRGVQLDVFQVREQLRLVSESDILIGMHGAAMAFNLVMQSGSGVIELYPADHPGNWHIGFMAEKSGLHYASWRNDNRTLEHQHSSFTEVPPSVVVRLLSAMQQTICRAWA